MILDFRGRRALVTGATRGIGAAIAAELLASGATVVATGTDPGRLRELQDEADRRGAAIHYEPLDLCDREATAGFAGRMAEQPVDVLVNNAGINKIAAGGDIDPADWDRIQDVNVRGPMLLCRALLPPMAARRYGRVVNITSVFGHVTRAMRASYTASKFALFGLTRTFAVEFARDNVMVNGLAPGFIDTELTRRILTPDQRAELAAATPIGRLGTSEEIARVALFLASEANSFVTGQLVIADGGFTSV